MLPNVLFTLFFTVRKMLFSFKTINITVILVYALQFRINITVILVYALQLRIYTAVTIWLYITIGET